jgi:hypothetical protein
MSVDTEVVRSRSEQRSGRRIVVAATAAAIVGALSLGIVVGRRWTGSSADETTTVRATPSVVVAIRDLARLEGAEFRIDRVVSLTDKQDRFFGLVEAKDAILLVASGAVVAGTDLSGLADGDVVVDAAKHHVRITLPSSQVLSARLDDNHTFVYRRDTDLLAERKESLESRARQEAERTLEEAARQGGILTRSNDSVRRTVDTLLRALGFTEVEVVFRGAPSEASSR